MTRTAGPRRVRFTTLVLTMLISVSALPLGRAQTRGERLNEEIQFAIPAQPLATALVQFSMQAKVQLVTSSIQLGEQQTQGVNGRLSIQRALEALLDRTGLAYNLVGENTVAITPPADSRSEATAASATHFAQAPESRGAESSLEEGKSELEENIASIPEIIVVGSRSLNMDIVRTEDDAQPYVVIAAEEIQRSGATSLEQFFQSRLPMNTQQAVAGQASGVNGQNGGSINLRGLGVNQTLVLIDGRPAPRVFVGSQLTQANIAGIPLSAIERVEVLPATAGGIYGGSATGGVINIILKRDYSGVDVEANYGNAFDADTDRRQLSINGGLALEDGRTRVTFGAAYSDGEALFASDRNEIAANRRIDAADPALPLGYTPNICATASTTSTTCASTNLVLDAAYGGQSLGSPRTFVPPGYSGVASDNAAALRANAGTYNLNAPSNSSILLQAPESHSLSLNIRREFTQRIDAFLDLYRDSATSSLVTGAERIVNIPANSPANPFQQNIIVNLPVPNLAFPQSRETETSSARLGLIARLPFNWGATLEYGWSRSTAFQTSRSLGAVTASGTGYLQSIALRDPNALPPDDPASLFTEVINESGPSENTLAEAALRAGGPLFRLPAGEVTLSALLMQQEEDLDAFTIQSGTSYFWYPPASGTTWSAYLEARAPIVSDRNAVPLVRDLELMGAVRYGDYKTRAATSTIGFPVPAPTGPFPDPTYSVNQFDSTDYTVGLLYKPVRDLTFRASYSTGFLAPSLNRIVTTTNPAAAVTSGVIASLRDPLRGGTALTGDPGTPGQLTLLTSGNPNLQPEESKSLSFGMIFRPRFIEGLRLSVDYVHIEKVNEIATPLGQFILDNEALYPGRVSRAPNLPGDPSGWAGPITLLDITGINLASTQVRATDYQLDYTVATRRWGEWRVYAIATHMLERASQTIPTSAPVDSVGFSSGQLEWRGNAGIDWRAGGWSIGWNAQYFDEYNVCSAAANAASCATTIIRSGGATMVPSQTYHDLYVTYGFDEARLHPALSGLELSLGVQNVLDDVPPFIAENTVAAYSQFGDPRLRRFTLTLRKHF